MAQPGTKRSSDGSAGIAYVLYRSEDPDVVTPIGAARGSSINKKVRLGTDNRIG